MKRLLLSSCFFLALFCCIGCPENANGPDAAISGVLTATPEEPGADQEVSIKAMVKNNSTTNLDGVPTQLKGSDGSAADLTTAAIKAGESVAVTFTVKKSTGRVDYTFVIDPSNVLKEKDEGNNRASISVEWGLLNAKGVSITESSISWSTDTPRETVIKFTLKNGRTSPKRVYYRLVNEEANTTFTTKRIDIGPSASNPEIFNAVDPDQTLTRVRIDIASDPDFQAIVDSVTLTIGVG